MKNKAAPDTLIVGQGAYRRMRVPDETARVVQSAGIELIVLPTPAAVEQYNARPASRRVAAALHLTC